MGEAAKFFADAGFIYIAAFISPSRADRQFVRDMLPEGKFIEVYVNAPIEVCEQRDPQGLYAKARANEIENFIGVSASYEPPERPELELHTDQESVTESVARILVHLHIEDIEGAITI